MRFRHALPVLLSIACLAPALAQGISYKSTALAPGLYMLEGVGGFGGGNMGLLTGDDGTFLIDDGLPPLTGKLLAAIGEITDDDVDYLVNTHVHGDHTGGNEAFGKADATIVAHDNLRRRMVEDGVHTATGMGPAPEDALPVLTFSDAMTLHLNDRTAYVFHVAAAHTDGDAIIHFREDDVIHMGDVLFNRIFPFIDLDSGGSVEGFIAAQKKVLAMMDDDTRIIPGHGPLASREDLQASIDMLEDGRAKVRALIDAGKSDDEILAENPLSDYESWSWQFINTERMTRTLIRGAREG